MTWMGRGGSIVSIVARSGCFLDSLSCSCYDYNSIVLCYIVQDPVVSVELNETESDMLEIGNGIAI